MGKHTPGPWRIERSGGGWVREVVDQNGSAICYGSIEDADARLIAAAPDMYEALRLALDEIRECDDTGGVRAKINAALAKAGGQ